MSDQPQENVELTDEEKRGIKMIQYLQLYVGITESDEVSLANWRSFSEWDKEQTKAAYDFLTDLDDEFEG